MKTFYDALLSNFNDVLKYTYVGRIVDEDLIVIRDMNEIVDITDLRHYCDFLDALPKDKYNEVSIIIWKYIFNLSIEKQIIIKKNDRIKKSRDNKKANEIITSDLNTIQKFKSIMERVFYTDSIGTHIKERMSSTNKLHRLGYSPTNSINDKKLYSIDDLFEMVDLIIDDLETKNFKFIGKNTYYEYEKPTKQAFKNWLEDVCKEHNINNHNYKIRELTDNLTIK